LENAFDDGVRETAIAIVVSSDAANAAGGVVSDFLLLVLIVGGDCGCWGVGGGADGGKLWQPASCAASLQISHFKALVRVIDEDPILGNFTALRNWR